MTLPLVSILVGTHNRDAWIPWVQWNFERQTYPNKELIVVASDTRDESLELLQADPRIRVVKTPPSYSGAKRNVAAELAQGEISVFWDDDDWYHPERTAWMVEGFAQTSSPIVGWAYSWFLDPKTRWIAPYHIAWSTVALMAVRTEFLRAAPFTNKRISEDSAWLNTYILSSKSKVTVEILPKGRTHSLWLVHGANLAQTSANHRWVDALGTPTAKLLDTDEEQQLFAQIADVQKRLG